MKLEDLAFWRSSATVPVPIINGKVILEEAKITTSDSSLAQLDTYIQIDPDSGYKFEKAGSVETISLKSLPHEEIEIKTKAPKNDSTELFRKLVQEACLVNGTEILEFPLPIKYPDWVNHALLAEGKRFAQKHFFAILWANIIGIFLLITIKPVQALLIRSTRKSYQKKHDANNSMRVYLNLFLQLQKWYNLDFNGSFSDVQTLRHQLASKAANFRKFIPPITQDLKLTDHENLKFLALRYDLNKTENQISTQELKNLDKILTTINPEVPLSQYDLAVAQFGLFGLIFMFPSLFGIYERSEKGLKGFVHLWALLGHLLGIRDEFNLALHAQDTQTQKEVFQHIFRFSFRIVDRTDFRLWKSMYLGFGNYFRIFLMPFDCLLYFVMQSVFGLFLDPGKKEVESSYWIIMSLWAKFCSYLNKFCFKILLRSCIFRWIFNGMARALLWFSWFFYIRNQPEENSRKFGGVKWTQGDVVEIGK